MNKYIHANNTTNVAVADTGNPGYDSGNTSTKISYDFGVKGLHEIITKRA